MCFYPSKAARTEVETTGLAPKGSGKSCLEMLLRDLLPVNSRVQVKSSRRKYTQPTPWVKGEWTQFWGLRIKGTTTQLCKNVGSAFHIKRGESRMPNIVHLHPGLTLPVVTRVFFNNLHLTP